MKARVVRKRVEYLSGVGEVSEAVGQYDAVKVVRQRVSVKPVELHNPE